MIEDSEEESITITESDNLEVFGKENKDIGGLAIALPHGSVMFECAKKEVHATTALKNPNRLKPKRIAMVLYRHKDLEFSDHGYERFNGKWYEKQEIHYEMW